MWLFFNFRDRAHVGCHWAVEFRWTRRDGPSCASSPSATMTRWPRNSSSSSPTSARRTPPPTLELSPQTPPARCSNNHAQADERTKASPLTERIQRIFSRGQSSNESAVPIIGWWFSNRGNCKPALSRLSYDNDKGKNASLWGAGFDFIFFVPSSLCGKFIGIVNKITAI